jgi:chemotaxis protein CheX
LDRFEAVVASGQPVAGEIRDKLLEPLILATCQALGEMAGSEVVVRAMFQKTINDMLGDISAVLELKSAKKEFLVLGFPHPTAAALAGRILADVTREIDENLIRDCMGEIANVIAGQAKALLAETPYRFAFSVPKVVVSPDPELLPGQDLECLVVTFSSDLGEFALQLYLEA